MFLGKEMLLPKNISMNDVEDYLNRIDVKELKERIPIAGTCLIADLKINALLALKQLARCWLSFSPETEVIGIYFYVILI